MATSNSPFQRRYPPEMRERAVRMVRETIAERGERIGAVTRVARQLGIGPESLRNWLKQAEIDGGKRPGVTTAEQRQITELEREVRELRRANEMAVSTGRRNDRYELLQWCHIAERFARPAVEAVLDATKVSHRALREIGSFRQILPQQAVGVLV
jgi:transposase